MNVGTNTKTFEIGDAEKRNKGIFRTIVQWNSDLKSQRTSEGMRDAARQGYFPCGIPPYGYQVVKVDDDVGEDRSVLEVNEHEAEIVRELFLLYIASSGANQVAQVLNQKQLWYRNGKPWSKSLVLAVLDSEVVAGTYYFGKSDARTGRRRTDPSEWVHR